MLGRERNAGASRAARLRSSAESLLSRRTMAESGPVLPPKTRQKEVLNAERVCHARVGPWNGTEGFWEPERYCHGGLEGSKGVERGRKRRSLFQGAESYP